MTTDVNTVVVVVGAVVNVAAAAATAAVVVVSVVADWLSDSRFNTPPPHLHRPLPRGARTRPTITQTSHGHVTTITKQFFLFLIHNTFIIVNSIMHV